MSWRNEWRQWQSKRGRNQTQRSRSGHSGRRRVTLGAARPCCPLLGPPMATGPCQCGCGEDGPGLQLRRLPGSLWEETPHTGRCFTTRGNSSAGHTPHCALSRGSRPQEGVRDPGPPWLSRAGDLWGSLALRLQTQLTWGGSESVATAPARGLTAFPGRAGNAGAAAGRRGHSEPPQLGDQVSCVHLTCGGTALLLSPLQAQSRDPG